MTGKTIILGIGGGIAAYKVADLASKLTQAGADVHAVLTEGATHFIQPLTFQALTHNPALTSLWVAPNNDQAGKSAGMPHIALADQADLIVVAPASADLLARLAHGFADDLLTTLVLATKAPVLLAPAMNPTMLANPATQRNLELLAGYGYNFIDPESGRMACEHFGTGRLPETAVLMAAIAGALEPKTRELDGKTVIVTAGPTREALDPVRYVTNRSSGKMGYAIAAEAARRGARVLLVSGPTSLPEPPGVQRIPVTTALQMREATVMAFEKADILIASAAPADFRAAEVAPLKIKRAGRTGLTLELTSNPDIVAECGRNKRPGQFIVGFAAETGNAVAEARRKLVEKNLDAIVANDVTQEGAGFDVDTNRVTWVTADQAEEWPLLSKSEVAGRIWDEVVRNFS